MLDLEEVLKGSVQLLSRMTQYAGLAVPPSASEEPIVRLELIDMGPTIMVLAVGQHGRVDKRIVDRPDGADATVVAAAEARLAPLRGATYGDAQARLLQLAAEGPRDEHDLILLVADTLRFTGAAGPTHVVIGGVSNLADEAQLWRRETVRRLFEALEKENEVLRVLQDVSTDAEGVAVTIGGEHPSTGEWEASIVTAPFKAGDATLGTIGIVGPTRMDYVTAMASVRAVAKRLSELATELEQ
jgi:heat-inducible transcriptional repressor